MVHKQSGDVLRVAWTVDPLPRLWSRTYYGIDDDAQTAYAWDRARN